MRRDNGLVCKHALAAGIAGLHLPRVSRLKAISEVGVGDKRDGAGGLLGGKGFSFGRAAPKSLLERGRKIEILCVCPYGEWKVMYGSSELEKASCIGKQAFPLQYGKPGWRHHSSRAFVQEAAAHHLCPRPVLWAFQ